MFKKIFNLVSLVMIVFSTASPVLGISQTTTPEDTSLRFVDNSYNEIQSMELNHAESKTVSLKAPSTFNGRVEVPIPEGLSLNSELTNELNKDNKAVSYDNATNKLSIDYDYINSKSMGLSNSEEGKIVSFSLKGNDTGTYELKAINLQNNNFNSSTLNVKVDNNSTEQEKKSNLNPIVMAGNANVDLDISSETTSIASGNDAPFKLTLKTTGIETVYNNANIVVTLAKGYHLNQDLSTLAIDGVTPSFDSDTSTLNYHFDALPSGQSYTRVLRVKTENGTTPDKTILPISANFTADNFTGNAQSSAQTTIVSSSEISVSKGYNETQTSGGTVISSAPVPGNIGVWELNVKVSKKSEGMAYLKEGSSIQVTDPIPSGLTYVSDDNDGQYNPANHTVTWTFPAPSRAMQDSSLNEVFNKTIKVKTSFDSSVKPYEGFKNTVFATANNINQSISSNASASVSTGNPNPSEPVTSPGTEYLPWHVGPNADGNYSNDSAANPDNVFFNTQRIKFANGLVPWQANSRDKDFSKYEVNYLIDPHLNLDCIEFESVHFQPDTAPTDMHRLYTEGDIYITRNGQEQLLTHFQTGDSTRYIYLSDYGISKDSHVESVRIHYTKVPAGSLAYYGIHYAFNIDPTYTGPVKNEVKYNVEGYDVNGNSVKWDNVGDFDKVEGNSGYRTAQIVAPPKDSTPVATTSIHFDRSNNNIVDTGSNRITGSFNNVNTSSQLMTKPINAMVLLPVGTTIDNTNPSYSLKNEYGDWDQHTSDGNNANGKVTIVDNNYKGTGRQLVKVVWNSTDLRPSQEVGYGFNVQIDNNAPSNLEMETYGFSGDEKLSVPSGAQTIQDSYLQVDTDDLNQDGNKTQDRVESGNVYHILRDNQVTTEKLVKGDKDNSYSKFGKATLGGKVAYKLQMTNKGSDIHDFKLMEVLPSSGDLGITDGRQRESKFSPTMSGPIQVPADWLGKVKIEYSEATNPSRHDLDKDVKYPNTTQHLQDPSGAQNPNWKTSGEVTDWSKIHSFMITLDSGTWVSGSNFTLDFQMSIPNNLSSSITNPSTNPKDRAAWNSFAYTVNNSQVVEPEKVGVAVDYVGSVVLTKKDDSSGKTLSGAEFELQNDNGDTLKTGLTTDDQGQLKVDDLAPGDYQFVETKAPKDYVLDKTPVKFTIVSSQTAAATVEKTNKLIPGSVVLTKKDDSSGKTLSGAEFELQNDNGDTLKTGLTTDDQGQLKVDDLAPGDYQFVETKAPKDYVLDKTPVKFTIVRSQAAAATVEKTNKLIPGSVVLTKKDDSSGKTLSGAEFELQNDNGDTLKTGLTTDDQGQLKVDDLAPGDYQFVETKAPKDYVLDKTPVKFTIVRSQAAAATVEKTNKLIPGSVVLTKKDDSSGKTLSGAEFELQNDNGDTLKTELTTDDQGQLKVDDLAPGDYQFVETKAPKDYVLDKTPVKFTIVRSQTAAATVEKTNKLIPGSVVLTKKDDSSGKTLSGAEFELQNDNGDTLKTELTTDDQGQLKVDDLAPGDYQFVETKAPKDYVLDKTPVKFTIVRSQTAAATVEKTNKLIPGSVVLTKKDDSSGKTLSGAEFELQNDNGDTLKTELTTDDQGQLKVDDLAPGDYQFVETKAPKDYVLDKTPVKFTIVRSQTAAATVEKTNKLIPGSVVLTKKDDSSGKTLSGAEFELQNDNGDTLKTGLTTDDQGQLKVDDLAPGDYQFVETKAPKDYVLDKTPVKFTIVRSQAAAATVEKTNKLIPGSVVLTKKDDSKFLPDTGEKQGALMVVLGLTIIILSGAMIFKRNNF